MKSISVFRKIGIGIVLLLAVCMIFFGLKSISSAGADTVNCVAPDGYQLIGNQSATTMSGEQHWIARAIVPTGKGNGGKSVTIPACTTTDDSLEPFGGVYVQINGNVIYVENGVWSKIIPLTPTPQQ